MFRLTLGLATDFRWTALVALLLGAAMPCDLRAVDTPKPNIVFILADDLGTGDVGCFGAKDLKTPNIDSLTRDGMKFTSFYVHQRCSPSRLSLMTGCYAHRVGTTKVIYPRDRIGIHPDEITTPELLKKAGYTCGIVGKWHLGDWEPFHPLNHGFDYFKGAWHVKSENAKPGADPDAGEEGGAFVENRKVLKPTYTKSGATEHEEVDGALKFIEANKERPFFLYYASRGTHARWRPSKDFKGKSKRGDYGDAVQELDFEVGRLLKKLDDLGLSKSTLVIFGSDNGAPESSSGPSNGPLRGGKWTNFEGGIRTPCVMRWPNRIPAGSTCDAISGIWDMLPTFCELAEIKTPSDRVIDGVSLVSMMLQKKDAKQPHDDIIMANSTIRQGDWKLYLKQQKPGGKSDKSDTRQPAVSGSLFNLKTDMGETKNVASENPEIVKQLRARAEAFQKELAAHSRPIGKLDDLMKKPNPKNPDPDK